MSNGYRRPVCHRHHHRHLSVRLTGMLAFTLCLAFVHTAMAEGGGHSLEIDILVPPAHKPVIGADAHPGTSYKAGKTGIALFGKSGNSNPYTVIADMPAVSLDTIDPYGLSNTPYGNKGLRIRGEMMPHGGIGSVDGIPLSGINPGPGSQWLFDMENISSVSVEEGPVAPDRLAFFTNTGTMDSSVLWPTASKGVNLSQSLGSYGFRRTFLRLDSGKTDSGGAMFVSASSTAARKWRGPGNAPDGRSNFEAAFDQQVGNRLNVKLYTAYSEMKGSNYRPLTYAEASDLEAYNYFDYSAVSSATPTQAVNYYGYNRQEFTDGAVFSEVSYRMANDASLIFKPFYMSEQGNYLDGMANGMVRKWLISHNWYGFTGEYRRSVGATEIKAGYWWDSLDPPGPPTAWKMYNPTATGGLAFASWSLLGKTVRRHQFSSVYVLVDHHQGALELRGGARHVTEKLPSIDVYNTAGIGDVSYEQALAASSGVIVNRSASGPVFHTLLPYLAASYDLTDQARLKLSAGRNYGAPSFDVWPVYQMSATLKANYTAQQIWNMLRPELTDAVDAGVHFSHEGGYAEPTLFYAKSHNKGVSFVDPAVGVAYPQNAGETHAYGLQLAASQTLWRNLQAFGSFTWERAVFDQNFTSIGGATLLVKGLQLPDTPSVMASMGVTYRNGNFNVSPVMHYTGKRYGDALQHEPVSAYTTVDLNLGYDSPHHYGNLHAALSVANLFNKRYIGFINASYLQNAGQTSYYPGAPRSVVASLSLDM